jgi:hypothetical protein
VGAHGEETVVGDTPNIAARLQSLAEPGCVLVGPITHQLTKHFFEFSFVGEHAIKGFREPVAVWKVIGEAATETRFAAAHSTVPIVERERELAFLHDAWRRASQGDGHVVLVIGDAGMGKSRLLEALAEQISEPHTLLRCQCSPYHRNSVLFLSRHCCGIGLTSDTSCPFRIILLAWTAFCRISATRLKFRRRFWRSFLNYHSRHRSRSTSHPISGRRRRSLLLRTY